jgi:hypothetical protein
MKDFDFRDKMGTEKKIRCWNFKKINCCWILMFLTITPVCGKESPTKRHLDTFSGSWPTKSPILSSRNEHLKREHADAFFLLPLDPFDPQLLKVQKHLQLRLWGPATQITFTQCSLWNMWQLCSSDATSLQVDRDVEMALAQHDQIAAQLLTTYSSQSEHPFEHERHPHSPCACSAQSAAAKKSTLQNGCST